MEGGLGFILGSLRFASIARRRGNASADLAKLTSILDAERLWLRFMMQLNDERRRREEEEKKRKQSQNEQETLEYRHVSVN